MSLRWIVAFSAAERQSEKGGPGTEKCAGGVLGSQGIRRAAGRTRRRPVSPRGVVGGGGKCPTTDRGELVPPHQICNQPASLCQCQTCTTSSLAETRKQLRTDWLRTILQRHYSGRVPIDFPVHSTLRLPRGDRSRERRDHSRDCCEVDLRGVISA